MKNEEICKAREKDYAGHGFRVYREAIKASKREDVVKIDLNRGYKKATGLEVNPNHRPDALIPTKDGKVHPLEVQSPTDFEPTLRQRNQEALNQLPKEMRGEEVKIKKPTSSKK